MIRIAVKGVLEEPDWLWRKRFDDITEFFVSMLRIFFDEKIALTQHAFRYGNLIEDGLPASLNIDISLHPRSLNLDANTISAFWHSDNELKDILRLYADALYPYLPVQYRFLSAFKILEHEYKVSRHKWRPSLDVLLSHFQGDYEKLDLSNMKFSNLLIHLRDKCAHIKLGNATELTIIGIGSQDTKR